MMSGSPTAAIETRRLSLRWFSRRFMEESLAGRTETAASVLPGVLPAGWPDAEAERRMRTRLEQMEEDPDSSPWLLRGLVRRSDLTLVGYINFHGPPDRRGRAELGYQVFDEHRRQGYASEAIEAMMGWAWNFAKPAAFVASISPLNAASLNLAAKLGFEKVGSQIDEIDGEEWVFELKASKRERRESDRG